MKADKGQKMQNDKGHSSMLRSSQGNHTPSRIDYGAFLLWSYLRPVGHPKSYAVRAGYAPMTLEWAYALKDGAAFNVSKPVSGFASKEQAEHYAMHHSEAGKVIADKIHAASIPK